MTLTLLTPIILMITSVIVVISALSSRRTGFIFSSIHLGISVACAFFAAIMSSVFGMIFREPIEDMWASFGLFDSIPENVTPFIGVFESLLALTASLVFFIPMFVISIIIFRLLFLLIFKSKIARLKVDSDGYLSENATFLQKNDKLFATLVGVVCGLFMSIAILSPVTGAFRSANVVMSIIDDGVVTSDMDVDEYTLQTLDSLEDYSNDFTVTVYDACGGRALYNVTTTFIYCGDISNFSSELRTLDEIDLTSFKESLTDDYAFDEDFIRKCNEIIDSAEGSPTVKMLLAVCAREIAEKWIVWEPFMDVSRPEVTANSTIRDLFDEMFKVLTTSDEETVCEDLKTLIVLVDIISEYSDALDTEQYADITDALISGNLLERLKQTLASNPRMRSVEDAADELLMRIVAEEISDYTKFTYEMREDLFEKIAEVLTDTSDLNSAIRQDIVFEEVQSALEDYGVYTNSDLSDKITEILITEIGSTRGEVYIEDIRAYFDAFLEN